MTSSENILVFTDLDGTLIDHDTYSWGAAEEAIGRLKAEGMPIIPCTSKTRTEIDFYRKRIGLIDPFISENGGGVFIPEDYFDFNFEYGGEMKGYKVIELGTPYKDIRRALDDMRSFGDIIGFGDMSAEEVAEDTGLSMGEARMAKEREYDEAFKFSGDEDGLRKAIGKAGLNWTRGGRYWHIMGENDKGKAVKILVRLFERKLGAVRTVGLGDSLNDLPMLRVVDIPILVQKKDGGYDARVDAPRLIKANAPGPEGWNDEILRLLFG